MRKIIFLAIFALMSVFSSAQDKIAGQFSTEIVTLTINQQLGQQGMGSTINVSRTYLTVDGKKYKLFRFTKEQIAAMFRPNNGSQQVQQPINIINEDYYLVGNQQENAKYCLIMGTVDHDKGIIYNASLLEVFDESKITKALNKCGY